MILHKVKVNLAAAGPDSVRVRALRQTIPAFIMLIIILATILSVYSLELEPVYGENDGVGSILQNLKSKDNCPVSAKHFKIICYIPMWLIRIGGQDSLTEEYLDPYQCSYYVMAHFLIKRDPVWTVQDFEDTQKRAFYQKIVALKKINPSVRILLGIGGYGDNQDRGKYLDLMSIESATKSFALNLVQFLLAAEADGIDFQLWFPGNGFPNKASEHRELLARFTATLCPYLRQEGLVCKISLMRVGVAENVDGVQVVDPEPLRTIIRHADLVGIWAEDVPPAATTFKQIWHSDNLYPPEPDSGIPNSTELAKFSVDKMVRIFTESVLNKDDSNYAQDLQKLTLTIPLQANAFDLTKYKGNRPPDFGADTFSDYSAELTSYSFAKACTNARFPANPRDKLQIKSHYVSRGVKSSPIAYNDHILIPINDPESVQDKVRYAREMGLGGVSLYQLGSDDVYGLCYNRSFPLLNAANDVLGECRQF